MKLKLQVPVKPVSNLYFGIYIFEKKNLIHGYVYAVVCYTYLDTVKAYTETFEIS